MKPKLGDNSVSGETTILAQGNIKVCAVTVAYNNPGDLTRLLSSLDAQNDSVSGLVIVDNSDDCYSAANERVFKLYSNKYSFTRYHITESNIGSAGGFRWGMETAHKNGFDWVWLLDQDGTVSPGCLTELLKNAAHGDILCPNISDIRYHVREPKAYIRNALGGLHRVSGSESYCRVHAFGSHGVLISKKTLDTIGYYDDSLFFVGNEDLDYGYRATQAGLVILFVAGAEALHPNLPLGSRELSNVKIKPAYLRYVSTDLEKSSCSRIETKSIAPLSQVYLESRYLKPWQFGLALAYSWFYVLYFKILGDRVSLTSTLRLHLKCLA
ncbi:MAG: glycosyltransferase, partial [Halobacteriota archaeon]